HVVGHPGQDGTDLGDLRAGEQDPVPGRGARGHLVSSEQKARTNSRSLVRTLARGTSRVGVMSFVARTGPAAGPRPGLRARLRRLADAAVTPLDLDDVLDVFHPLRGGAELRGRVVAVTPETAESATIVVRPGRDWA